MPAVYSRRRPAEIPRGAIYVGRPTIWRNPFHIGADGTRQEVIIKFCEYLDDRPWLIEKIKVELRGKDLVCWCAPSACHADVLLELANGSR